MTGALTRRALLTSGAAALGGALTACGDSGFNFRYRLAFSALVAGETKSASSIIDVLYYGMSGTASRIDGHYFHTMSTGVAPVLDLGARGMLAAAMFGDLSEYYRRKKLYNLTSPPPQSASAFPAAFGGLDVIKEARAGGKKDLPPELYPAFIWFPAGASYRQAQQISAEEFSRVIGGGARLQTITIEAATRAPLVERLPIRALWLDEIRYDQARGFTGNAPGYKPNRHSQLETGAPEMDADTANAANQRFD